MHRQKREIASDIGLRWPRPLGFSMVSSTGAKAFRGADAESSLRRMRIPAPASMKPRARQPFLRKRPKQRAADGACSVEPLVFLIVSRVGYASCSRRLRACCSVHSFLCPGLWMRDVIDHVGAGRCLTAAFPEVHLNLL